MDISSFVDRKNGNGSKYNYDLKPLVANFTFIDFIYNALKYAAVGNDYGAFLVITNKQYILGYNAGFGFGTHISSFARTFVDLNGGGSIATDQEALKLYKKCKETYLTGRITYECVGENENRRLIYKGGISFSLNSSYITNKQFEVFKKFYDDYNQEIEKVVKKYSLDGFCVWVSYEDENGKSCVNKSDNLDNLYNLLEKRIDENKELSDEENILGIEIERISKKMS